MPRKKKILDEDSEMEKKGFSAERTAEEEVDYEDQEIGSMFDGMPSGVRCISIFRITGGERGGRPKFISQIAPECFEEPFIQEHFGGGLYFARWKKKDGKILRSKQMEIDGPPKEQVLSTKPERDEEDEGPIRVQGERSYPSQGPENGNLSAIELFKLINDERREARAEAREEMRTLLELMKPQPQSADTTRQVFDIVEKVMSMAQAGGGDGSNPWMTALAMFKDPLTKIVDTVQMAVNRPAVPSVPPVSRPNPPTPQLQPAQPPQPTQEADVVTLMLSRYLPMFIEAASTGEDAGIYADMIIAKVPETQYAVLQQWLERPDCLDGLVQINPAVGYQKAWWIELRQLLLESLTNGPNVQSDPTSEQSSQD